MALVAAARGTRSAREVSKMYGKVKGALRRQTRVVKRVAGVLEVMRRILRVIMPLSGEGEVAVVAERRCERSTIRDSLLVASAAGMSWHPWKIQFSEHASQPFINHPPIFTFGLFLLSALAEHNTHSLVKMHQRKPCSQPSPVPLRISPPS